MARRTSIKIIGLNKLSKKLKKNRTLEDVKKVVLMNTVELENLAKRNAVFVKGYSKRTTKRSINMAIDDNGFTGTVKPSTEYSVYLEYGTRYMSAQPFMKPSFLVQKTKFINDMKRLMK